MMDDSSVSPLFVAFLFVLRCLVPIGILFGISYLLRRLGLVVSDAPEPPDSEDRAGDSNSDKES